MTPTQLLSAELAVKQTDFLITAYNVLSLCSSLQSGERAEDAKQKLPLVEAELVRRGVALD